MAILKINSNIIKFILVFSLVHLVFFLITIPKISSQILLKPYNDTVVHLSRYILNITDISTSVDGDIIKASNFELRVGEGCNALYEIMLFLSAVIAFEAPLRSKVYGIGFGLLVIYILNLIPS